MYQDTTTDLQIVTEDECSVLPSGYDESRISFIVRVLSSLDLGKPECFVAGALQANRLTC